ncbi:MAG: homocysteine S-methyltransferase family protein [Isosphaeraceae bacterium]
MSRLESLLGKGLVITDGAWGTEFQKRSLPLGQSPDLWNLSRPEAVLSVASSYVEAGSQVILTNTFRGNSVALAGHADVEQAFEINRRGAALSKEAAGDRARVFGSMGPTGKVLAAGEIEAQTVTEAFRRQAEALAAGGADALLFETFSDVEEARLAVQAAQPTGLPIVVSFAFDSGKKKDRTMMGQNPEAVARAMAEAGVDAVGANCGAGPEHFPSICRRLKDASGLPVWIKPNAGMPTLEDGRAVYTMSPGVFASYLPALVEAGASFVGGCCGTSPAFVQALVRAAASCASS